MLDLVWLAIAFPLIGVLINGLFGRVIRSKLISGIIGCTALGLSFAVAVLTWLDYTYQFWTTRDGPYYEVVLWPWMYIGNLKIDAGLLVDPLSIVMFLFVTGVSFLIHIYSTGYMAHDEGYSRFFTYLNLFVAMMLILVLGNNGAVMFVGWEGVGLCSYLLIGFWYKDMYNANCGMKAFVVNRIGDFGVLLGLFMLFTYFGSLNFTTIFKEAGSVLEPGSWIPLAIALFLFLGATGKSAQFPLHIWLPDAMAGPTPVSALIHAATMVTAGVYMVARLNPIFNASPTAGFVVALVGCFTAFMAATVAMTQNDIKKVLAYSTVSQLGYMFLACGVGAYWVAIFHVVTHAFFKACLFLGSGSVIHGMHEEQDTRYMGALAKFMPWTYFTFLASTIAIAGIIPFAGFFSKDEILWQVAIWQTRFGWAPTMLWIVAALTALMTAFYMGRVTWKTFQGQQRWTPEFVEKHKHPHESGAAMVMPLVVLSALAVVAGFLLFTPPWLGNNTTLKDFLAPSTANAQYVKTHAAAEPGQHQPEHELPAPGAEAASAGHAGEHHAAFISLGNVTATEIAFAAFSVLLALIGLLVSRQIFVNQPKATEAWKKHWAPAYQFSLNKWFFDELYHRVIVVPGTAVAYACWRFFDLRIVDGIVNGTAWIVGVTGHLVRPLQTGFVRNYALYLLLGVVILLIFNLVK
ncbi:NADH-quinone oxidoreductase subunit L [bacterium]|nr:NADH-quinone oxidoreductase subunit L [bacterium]